MRRNMRLIAKQVTKQLGDGSTLEMALEVAAGKPVPAGETKNSEFKPEVNIDLTQLTEGESEAKQGMMLKSLSVLKESFSKGARCAAIPVSADQAKAKKKSSSSLKRRSGDDSAGTTKKAKIVKDPSAKKAKGASQLSSTTMGAGDGGMKFGAGSLQGKEISNSSRMVGALLTFLASEELMKAETGMNPSIKDRPSQLTLPASPSSAGALGNPMASSMYRRSPHAGPQIHVLPTPYGAQYSYPGSFDFQYPDALPSPVNVNGMFPLSPMNRDAMNAAGQHGYFFGPNGNVMSSGQVPSYWPPAGYPPIDAVRRS